MNPETVKEHLDQMKPGWIVSTGTERSLFDLLCAPEWCEGLIIRDINWKVKAYIDCIVLCLRLCDTLAEFEKVTKKCEVRFEMAWKSEMALKFDLIKKRLDADTKIPPDMKKYYQDNLNDIFNTYYGTNDYWRTHEPMQNVNYFKNPDQFKKLQTYARSGRIIATEGSINDLAFLEEAKITVSAVDTSNISDYTFLDIPVKDALVIWTLGTGGRFPTTFYSYPNELLDKKEREEFDDLTSRLKALWKAQDHLRDDSHFALTLSNNLPSDIRWKESKLNTTITASYNRNTLNKLRTHFDFYVFQIEEGKYVYTGISEFEHPNAVDRVMACPPDKLEKLNPRLKDLYPKLADLSHHCGMDAYMACMHTKGGKAPLRKDTENRSIGLNWINIYQP